MRNPWKFFRALSLALIFTVGALSITGCGSKERIVSVSGTVTHLGKPVPGLVVSFVPDAQTETGVSTGETDDSGRYTLKVVKSGVSGAVVGTHKVWVSLPREPYAGDKEDIDDKDKEERAKARKQKAKSNARSASELDTILKTYGRLDKTPLSLEVKDGSPIDLKLD